MKDITDLPHDLFLIVISHLSPQTCVRCRSVSRRWHAAFTDEANCLLLLRRNFPRCREMRLTLLSSSSSQKSPDKLSPNLKAELVQFAQVPRVWSSTFAHVARRYHHLNRATARVVEKLEMAPSQNNLFSFWGVAPWNRYLRLNEKTASFHYPDPSWSYSQEDGVLVYPTTKAKGDSPPLETTGHIYHVVDLSTGLEFPVPFDVRQKHVRRVRLAQGVLVFEWAEVLPYHQLNDREVVHRHYVSIFDIARHSSPTPTGYCSWTITFRSEFKLHFLGLPLNRSDRFFSAHTATHYAVYFWQPNRSLYQDDPIEQLAVWDISSPSPYRPSEDPKGRKRPSVERTPSLPTGLWSGKSKSPSSSSNSPSPPEPDPPTTPPPTLNVPAGSLSPPQPPAQYAPPPSSATSPSTITTSTSSKKNTAGPTDSTAPFLPPVSISSAPLESPSSLFHLLPQPPNQSNPSSSTAQSTSTPAAQTATSTCPFAAAGKKTKKKGKGKDEGQAKRSREKEFGMVTKEGGEVNMWSELLAKGHLSGDERWVVGEDERGRVTVMRF
ncbi:hypothetical protein B0T21DRAFT_355935 [Apiosordaria backusii]|uniref:F-box domain-containing protein n=1 Tax=Apiosordaria backusii TaxID=314023 RepID=A0AA40EZ20_9PEZI|nr:hypothetical protein B0T21DRAFT_355935 [Apiosordaria backusii]